MPSTGPAVAEVKLKPGGRLPDRSSQKLDVLSRKAPVATKLSVEELSKQTKGATMVRQVLWSTAWRQAKLAAMRFASSWLAAPKEPAATVNVKGRPSGQKALHC